MNTLLIAYLASTILALIFYNLAVFCTNLTPNRGKYILLNLFSLVPFLNFFIAATMFWVLVYNITSVGKFADWLKQPLKKQHG